MYNVFAVNIKTGERRLMESNLSAENADAFIKIAVARRGVETEFYIKEAQPPVPLCAACTDAHGRDTPASYVAAQSLDAGKTVNFVLICTDHADGWNEGGDWAAPMYPIGGVEPHKGQVETLLTEFHAAAERNLNARDAIAEASGPRNVEKRLRFEAVAGIYREAARRLEAVSGAAIFDIPKKR